MHKHMKMASPGLDEAFLDQVVSASAAAKDVVGQLGQLSTTIKEQLLGQDQLKAREAAEVLMRTYFGMETK